MSASLRLALSLVVLTFTLPVTAADLSLDQAFDQLRTYDDGQPNQALAVIERHVGRVSKDPELRPQTAGRLAVIVAAPQTSAAARLFACQQLKLVAHDAEVPLLSRLLDDSKTAELGRLVLETMPGEDATRALIAALGSPALSVQTLDPEPYSDSVIQQRHDQVARARAAGDRLESLTLETCCAQIKFERQDTGFCGVPVKDSHPPLRGGSYSCPEKRTAQRFCERGATTIEDRHIRGQTSRVNCRPRRSEASASLACYLDCGVQARAERGGVMIRQLGGRAYQFPGAEQAAGPTFGTVAFDAPKVEFEIAGLDPKKAYAPGFSWWDYDGGKRLQSLRFTGGEPAKTETALKDAPLPAYTAGRKGPAIGRVPIPGALLSGGKVRLSIGHSQGPNAVVSELWLIETQAGSPTATQARLDGGAVAAPPPPNLDAPADGTKVLLVTGNDYPGHPWRQTAPVLKSLLEKDPRLKVRVVEDPNALGSPKLKDWDTVIIHFMDWEVPGPGPDARENLKRFVAGGKGLMLTHFACGAWDGNEWPEFKHLAGRAWDPKLRGHDPHGKFRVDIADPEHPITQGLKPFETVDELYTCLGGAAAGPLRVGIVIVSHGTSRISDPAPMTADCKPRRNRRVHCSGLFGPVMPSLIMCS